MKIIRPLPKLPGSLPDSVIQATDPELFEVLRDVVAKILQRGFDHIRIKLCTGDLRTSCAASSNETGVLYGRL